MKKALSFLSLLILGAATGYLGMTLLGAGESAGKYPDSTDYYLIPALLIGFMLVVGIHELGHVMAGKTQDFSFYGLTVGPFSWKPAEDGKGIKFKWNTSLNVAGGIAIMLPEGDHDLAKRFTWFAAGGPLASLLLCAVCYGLLKLLPDYGHAEFLTLLIMLLSGAIFLATIIPFRTGGFASDGMRMLTFARNGPTAKADLMMLRALSHIRAGKPYDQLPHANLRQVAADTNVSEQQRVTAEYYLYKYTLATGDYERAAAIYQTVLDGIDSYPKGTQESFYLEQATLEAAYRHDLVAAEAAYAKYKPSPFTEKVSELVAEAAMANLRGDNAKVRELAPEIEKLLPKSMDQSNVPIIRRWLADWQHANV